MKGDVNMENKADKIMAILDYELKMELSCYKRSLEAMEKTRNPIKKRKLKKALDMFGAHVAALSYAISRINKEIED